MLPKKLKYYAKEINLKLRWFINKDRMLPGFIIVGAQKSGTTSLYSLLSQHPELLPSKTKELHFFSGGIDSEIDNYKKGFNWYQSHFPPVKEENEGKIAFEATPIYLFNPLVASRIKKALPNVKIIVMLRNPVDRAVSHYFHEKRKSVDPLSIINALEEEEERLKPVLQAKSYKDKAFIHYSYKSRGLYADQLKNYYKHFSPDQIHVINCDEFFYDQPLVLNKVFKFLSVDDNFIPQNIRSRNVAKNKERLDQGVYDHLKAFFLQPNKELYQLLGKDFDW